MTTLRDRALGAEGTPLTPLRRVHIELVDSHDTVVESRAVGPDDDADEILRWAGDYVISMAAEGMAGEVHWAAESVTYRATFTPQAWVRDQAVEVDPQGPTEWDCTAFVDEPTLAYLRQCAERRHEDLDDPLWGVVDNDDVFKHDPAAPEWIREWSGPFTIRIYREN